MLPCQRCGTVPFPQNKTCFTVASAAVISASNGVVVPCAPEMSLSRLPDRLLAPAPAPTLRPLARRPRWTPPTPLISAVAIDLSVSMLASWTPLPSEPLAIPFPLPHRCLHYDHALRRYYSSGPPPLLVPTSAAVTVGAYLRDGGQGRPLAGNPDFCKCSLLLLFVIGLLLATLRISHSPLLPLEGLPEVNGEREG